MVQRSHRTKKSNYPPEMADGLVRLQELMFRQTTEHLEEREQWERQRWQLLEERSQLRAMIDQVPDYLFVKDIDNRFVVANKAVASDLGRDAAGIIGSTDTDLHPIERAREFLADDQRVVGSGEPMIDKEEFVILPTGEQRWLSTSKVPMRDERGNITGLVGVARDITMRKRAEEQVRFLAYCDPLTRLANRSSFEEHLSDVASRLGLEEDVRLILIDLDRFKQVNDTFGHSAGDELLVQVALRLSEMLEGDGHVARLGGDEFVIVRGFASTAEEHAFYDLIVRQLSDFTIMGNDVFVGASVGVAKVHRSTTALVALREADIALYRAKADGRSRWQQFEAEMAVDLERRNQLEADLRGALLRGNQLIVHYQAIFNAKGSKLLGVEALVRWKHPDLGLLGPDQFVPLAEEKGLIIALGDLVLRMACEFLLRHPAVQWVAVNVSPTQLRDPGFAPRTLKALLDRGVNPHRLQLEITEGVLLEEFVQTRTLLDALRAVGVRIAIDDFGTGYSSLSYLGQLAVDKIKIDRSFVSGIGNPTADAIVRAIVAFTKALQISVTAEGVETEAQRSFLEIAGCDELQGYLLARPKAEGEMSSLISP